MMIDEDWSSFTGVATRSSGGLSKSSRRTQGYEPPICPHFATFSGSPSFLKQSSLTKTQYGYSRTSDNLAARLGARPIQTSVPNQKFAASGHAFTGALCRQK